MKNFIQCFGQSDVETRNEKVNIDQQRGANLDDDAAELTEFGAGHVRMYLARVTNCSASETAERRAAPIRLLLQQDDGRRKAVGPVNGEGRPCLAGQPGSNAANQ